ncbi:hypothetical protein [Qipengyuania qiaonensis]|uniref:Uncharacterized protein n=1 Tax=Qipengyuania qiaonensis TaxID=2867240 RepID=A0ABS7J0X4_9SPHN|nr:hypothetical protein [Qipengyuania qiaonensis]MBX7480999.1 hypothetical protein [Qipengyuania qiaonensis]
MSIALVLLLSRVSGVAKIGADDTSAIGVIGLLMLIVFITAGVISYLLSDSAVRFLGIAHAGWQSRIGRTVIVTQCAFASTILLGILLDSRLMIVAVAIGMASILGLAARWIYLGDTPR